MKNIRLQCAESLRSAGFEMSGDWIKMRGNLWDDPRITRMCDATGNSEAAIVGACYWLWATADQHSDTGTMTGLSLAAIDRKTGVKGFAQAMVDAGWLAESPEGVQLLRFEDHNGASAKKRSQTARRVATHRSNDPVTHDGAVCNAQSVTSALAREEKRREEDKTNTPIPPEGGEQPSKKKSATSLPAYLAHCKAEGLQPIPADDPVFDYVEKVGIPQEFLRLQWLEFKERYSLPDAKRYKSWCTVFLKSVKGNWFKLWYVSGDSYALSTVGRQANIQHKGAE